MPNSPDQRRPAGNLHKCSVDFEQGCSWTMYEILGAAESFFFFDFVLFFHKRCTCGGSGDLSDGDVDKNVTCSVFRA